MQIEMIKRLIDQNDIISFDIYDTLIKRVFDNPTDVFNTVERIYNKHNGFGIKFFKEKRIKAESIARKMSNKQDITLDDIYAKLDINEKNIIKNIEISVEISCSIPNIEMVEIFRNCIRLGKKIIITSDMYLPKTIIEKILTKCGIYGYNKLFVSGEVGFTKLNGDLFDYVSDEMRTKSILHIGDNFLNDYENAISRGLRAFNYIPCKEKKKSYFLAKRNQIELKYLSNFINKSSLEKRDNYFKFGYDFLGPIVYEYSKWLQKNIIKNNINKIIFLSREGFFLKNCYEEIYGNFCETYYFGLNNNVLFYPMLRVDGSVESFFENIPMKKDTYTAKYLFDVLFCNTKVSISDIVLCIDDNFKEKKFSASEWMQSSEFCDLYYKAYNFIKKDIYLQYDYLIDYIKKNFQGGNIALVNNSMSASAQIKLMKIVEFSRIDLNIWNSHFIKKKKLNNKNLNSFTWFGKNCKEISKCFFYSNCLVFETLLFPQTGTSIKYDFIDGNTITVYEDDSFANNNYKIISLIQSGATEFIRRYKKCDIYDIPSRYILDALCKFLCKPEYKDVMLFKDIVDFEDGNSKKFITKSIPLNKVELRKVWWKQGMIVFNGADRYLRLYNLRRIFSYAKEKVWE